MKEKTSIEILTFTDKYRDQAIRLLESAWGSTQVVSKGRIHDADQLPGFLALSEGEVAGLATYCLDNSECELVTLNSTQTNIGIGTGLISAVKEMALESGSRRLWVITTNDNLMALGFYQRRGFKLAALHKNALRTSRRLKPQIPELGQDGIPLLDEIELEIVFPTEGKLIISNLHHVQITVPTNAVEEGRDFYCRVLGLSEIDKPESLKHRGGFWLAVGQKEVHVGIEDAVNRQGSRAHLAYLVEDISAWRDHLRSHGLVLGESISIPGYERFETRDPFGNRLEFMEKIA